MSSDYYTVPDRLTYFDDGPSQVAANVDLSNHRCCDIRQVKIPSLLTEARPTGSTLPLNRNRAAQVTRGSAVCTARDIGSRHIENVEANTRISSEYGVRTRDDRHREGQKTTGRRSTLR